MSSIAPTNSIALATLNQAVPISGWRGRVSSLKTKVQQVWSTCKNVSQSMMGRLAISSTKENIAEYLGYFAGSVMGAELLKRVMGSVGRQLGVAIASGGIGVAGTSVAYALSEPLENRHSVKKNIAAIMAGLTVTLGLYGMGLIEKEAQHGELIGSHVGAQIGDFFGGLLGGYIAIYLNGSSEKLWDSEDALNTYITKTIQCFTVFQLRDALYGPSSGLAMAVVDLCCGSLVYNAVDLASGVKKIREGHILDGQLSLDLSIKGMVNPELLISYLSEMFSKKFIQLIEKEIRLFAINATGGEIPVPLLKPKDEITSYFLDQLDDKVHWRDKAAQPSASLINKIITQEELHFELINQMVDRLLGLIIRAYNQYVALLKSNPHIEQTMGEFNEVFVKWHKEKDPQLKRQLLEEMTQKKFQLKEVISHELSHLVDGYSKIENLIDKTNMSKFIPLVMGSHLPEMQKLAIDQIGSKTKWVQESIDLMSDKIVGQVIQLLHENEMRIVGIPLTSEHQQQLYAIILPLHTEFVIKLTFLNGTTVQEPLNENEIREFYANITGLALGHYLPSSGQKIIERGIRHQLNNSQLIDSIADESQKP